MARHKFLKLISVEGLYLPRQTTPRLNIQQLFIKRPTKDFAWGSFERF